ncbi:unnamed protein product [Fasciola hepatica]|uniref:Uncharacterized protein n=1 Tax=Fasciola hepatica TaxID=6192 RepID=A0ABC9HHX7_FASHE
MQNSTKSFDTDRHRPFAADSHDLMYHKLYYRSSEQRLKVSFVAPSTNPSIAAVSTLMNELLHLFQLCNRTIFLLLNIYASVSDFPR